MDGRPVAQIFVFRQVRKNRLDRMNVDTINVRLSSHNNIFFIFIMRGLTATCRRTHVCSGSSKAIQLPAVWQDLRCHPRQPRLGSHDCVVILLSS